MRRLIFIIVTGLVLGLMPQPVFSHSTELEVVASVTLKKRVEPYVYSGIHVQPGGVLTLESGVVVSLTAGAHIAVEGGMVAKGTKANPVLFQAADVGEPWQGITATSATLSNVVFSNFLGPLALPVTASLTNLTLRDGYDNRIVVEGSSLSAPFNAQGLSFINERLGTDMQFSGVTLHGSFGNVTISDAVFSDTRIPYQTNVAQLSVDGVYNNFTVLRADFGYGCRQAFDISFHSGLKKAVLVVVPESCQTGLVPVLFVPGIGTSLNLKELSKSESSTKTITDWHFSKKYSASYFTFLKALDDTHVVYDVAYYDWRLPTAEAATRYLIPAIEKLKKRTGAKSVNIMAHSLGGIVARNYIQSDAYGGDVLNFVTVGTPQKGSAKSYGIWEAGELPADWSTMTALLRLYAYQHRKDHLTNQDVVQRYIRSVQDLLPRYPFLSYNGAFQSLSSLYYQNSALISLEKTEALLNKRTRFSAVYGSGVETVEQIATSYPAYKNQQVWPDGEPSSLQPPKTLFGDGTVPQSSAVPSFARVTHLEQSTHGELMSNSAKYLLQAFYNIDLASKQIIPTKMHLFAFDCPIRVQLVLPNGVVASSDQSTNEVEVEQSDEMILMFADDIPGTYQVHITALADTDVRTWVDDGAIETISLKKDENVELTFAGTTLQSPDERVASEAEITPITTTYSNEPNYELYIPTLPTFLSPFLPSLPNPTLPIFIQRQFVSTFAPVSQKVVPTQPVETPHKPYLAWVLLGVSFVILYCQQRE